MISESISEKKNNKYMVIENGKLYVPFSPFLLKAKQERNKTLFSLRLN